MNKYIFFFSFFFLITMSSEAQYIGPSQGSSGDVLSVTMSGGFQQEYSNTSLDYSPIPQPNSLFRFSQDTNTFFGMMVEFNFQYPMYGALVQVDIPENQQLGAYDIELFVPDYGWLMLTEGFEVVPRSSCPYPGFLEYNPNYDIADSYLCQTPVVNGCTDSSMFNYNPEANTEDGSCVEFVYGCIDTAYTEFNALANTDANPSLCVNLHIYGCSVEFACNYNSLSTVNSDNDSCVYTAVACETCSGAQDGTGTIIDNDLDDDGVCDVDEIEGCTDETACNYNSSSTVNSDNDLCIYTAIACETCSGSEDGTGVIYDIDIDDDGVCDPDEVLGCCVAWADNYNSAATDCDDSCIREGCMVEYMLNYDSLATYDMGGCILVIIGCLDSSADNYSSIANTPGICNYTGCPYPNFFEYNPNYTIADGSLCLTQIVEGCTNETAENFSLEANVDDGTCVIFGCMFAEAENFNPEATLQDESCVLYGCMNETAENYDEQANENDGSCIIYGCTVSIFPNYNPEATVEDVSCSFEGLELYGCIDENALNYYSQANIDNGTCTYDVVTVGCDYSMQAEQIPLLLPQGWSIFGFTCIEPMDAMSAFNPIMENVIIVKDGEGNAYLPEWNFNGIGDLVYSRGYQIKTSEEITDFSFCPTIIVSEVSNIPQYQIGDLVEGGIVFYIDETGEHGLVAALEDITEGSNIGPFGIAEGFEWGCHQQSVSGANGQVIGAGYQNTLDIVAQSCQTDNGGITAAQATLNYTSEGYTDWYLPSFDELQEMYNSVGNVEIAANIGGFETSDYPNYWSSSEGSDYSAWYISFYNGSTSSGHFKINSLRVRAVRAF